MKSRLTPFIAFSAAAAFGLFAAACGDDSSSSKADDTIVDESSSSEETGDLSSSSVEGTAEASSSSVEGENPGDLSSSSTAVPTEIVPFLPKGILLDDFEDGDEETAQGNGWYTYDDNGNGGASTIERSIANEGYQSAHAIKINYVLDKGEYGYAPYSALAVSVDKADFSNIGGFHYCYKGGAHVLRIETSDIEDYDVHGISIKKASNWTCMDIKFRDLAQEGWGEPVAFNKENINQFSIQVKGANSTKVVTDSLFIDNLAFINEDALPADVADLEARPAVIPTVEIGDVAISNPLQAKAMKYLDKGVNFTNWLEEADGKFTGEFELGEKDVQNLAKAGVKSLRLPIDLDLYVTNRKAFLAGTDKELTMDTESLFTVLDAFEKWTAENGLSLVIDYHEYDNSYNKTSASDRTYIAMMAGVWKAVAEHYAANDREDLFFELLNEPDMASGAVKADTLTIAAQAMIDAIRSVDKKHTIIFGDAQWYSITALAKRTPFEDDNIIYAIHTYEPMVFTHQGASWTDYATIRNLPFPYDEKTWSKFSADYGVSAATKSSAKIALNNYYKVASKEAILAQVYKAKEWAVKNNVPVIINEYGAYNAKSDKQSILNYYNAMREISEELEIPMQHWGYTGGFALFNNDGTLIEGMKDAFGLK